MRRVVPSERRRQILEVAARLLDEGGVDGVQITAVATRARVSRPLVYRLFPTRDALVVALVEDFVAALSEGFRTAVLRALPGSLDDIVRAFVHACCQAIEERGAGAWRLLDARGVDVALTRAGQAALDRLLDPWLERIGELTGLSKARAQSLMRVVVAAGRAMLEGWLERRVGKQQAIEDTTRVVTSILAAFASSATDERSGLPAGRRRARR